MQNAQVVHNHHVIKKTKKTGSKYTVNAVSSNCSLGDRLMGNGSPTSLFSIYFSRFLHFARVLF